jgi:hypothetical protein
VTEHYIDICYSIDGGRNFSKWRTVDVGTVGSFMKKCRIRRLGSGYTFIWWLRDTSPFKADLVACSVQAGSQ